MRTLLVDNYDSFTYNLFHHLAEVNGEEPVVVRNDEPGWRAHWRREFDNVVVSPGPGAPWCPADIGLCGDLIDYADVPLLGVCLGHQALAHRHRGRVQRAPEPVHGRLAAVVHTEDDLFASVPSPLQAVRYHSLAVTDLPPGLEATAWTTDGVLMGLRHRWRPQWGVQFHPESICSQYGHRLLANFAELTRRWQARTGTPPASSRRSLGRGLLDRASVDRAPRLGVSSVPSGVSSVSAAGPSPAARPAGPAAGTSVPAAGTTGPAADLTGPAGQAAGSAVPAPAASTAGSAAVPAAGSAVPAPAASTAGSAAVPAAGSVAAGSATGSATAAAAGARRLRVLVERLETRWVDEVVFDRLFRSGEHAFWLDSSRVDGDTGRFSIMGDASGPLARVATADVWTSTVTVRSVAGTTRVAGSFFDWLAADLAATHVESPPLPFDFALGWVGYLGYELKAECGGRRAHRSTEPDAGLIFADRAVVFDHGTSSTYLLALAEEPDVRAARDWLADTTARLSGLAGEPAAGRYPPATYGTVTLRHDRARYLDLIAQCQAHIQDGETYEVNLTNMIEAAEPVDWWPGYQFLRRTSPTPFGALLRFGELAVLSTSPERFLRVGTDRTVESRPIKGTRPRGATPYDDELLRKELTASEKDRAENLMIVDLVRNDLGRCAEVGSVRVDKLFEVETYATVHQLVSTIRARLRSDRSAVDCVRAAFPGGSMTGAPKIRTMRIIDDLEAGPRGVYAGAIGYFSLTGAADLSIVIRTAVVTPTRTRYGVGGAIVALSEPAEEYEETAVKAAPLLRLLDATFPDRT